MKGREKRRAMLLDVALIGPATLFFVAIVLVSFVFGFYYSFTQWNGAASHAVWIGFKNFIRIFTTDNQVGPSAWFTIRFTIASLVLSNAIALILALALTQPLRGAGAFRTLFFLPNVIGGIILGFIWRFILVDVFPAIGSATGLGFFNLGWLGDEFTAFWGTVIVFVWKTSGYLMVIYIASIMNVSTELIESARIEGASGPQMFSRIILPLIMPAVTVCLFLMLSWSTKLFDVIFALTHGGPFRSTEAFALNIYFEAFQNNNFGYASAKAVLFFLAVGALTLIQVTLTKRAEVEA